MHACIVTCGGLCPGLNTVIREIVCGLSYMYGVHKILGIEVSSSFWSSVPHIIYRKFSCSSILFALELGKFTSAEHDIACRRGYDLLSRFLGNISKGLERS